MKTSVTSNMKKQFKSHSDAVPENVMVCLTEGLADPTTLKNVGKSVVQEEYRIRNVLFSNYPRRMKTLKDEFRRY